MAGNGTIALEILEDLPDPDAVLIPYGGGGLTAGIASAIRALRPETKVYAVEPSTGAALGAALAAGFVGVAPLPDAAHKRTTAPHAATGKLRWMRC
jgi:threonine dehydratase